MNREQYQALIRRLEEYARRNPGGYRLRVGLLAALGYGYLLFILAILAGLLAVLVLAFTRGGTNFIVAKLGWVLIVLAAAIVRAMWVGIPAPSGIELRRDDAPELFGMLDEVRAALRTPRFDHVLLTDEFNAAAAQRPRLGVLGWQKNYLMLGLPMMQALSPEELRAIVAHELGHLSGNHARFGGWIYRVEAAWARLLQRFHEEGNHAAILFERFFNWYVPFFDAYSFVLRRANEYMADECSAEVVGRETTARALFRTEIAGRVLAEHYWPSVYERANRSPQ
ncbi:MAG TPA: M48 family metallopeptidase, partial [Armatimonadota bacterium]|nr:M48 family metallopeptidase [Armatimonadota bacterium]